MKKVLKSLVVIGGLLAQLSFAQEALRFALVTDTHVGSPTGAADLRLTVADINSSRQVEFVVLSGDITEFGSDEEIRLAKQILDSLNVKYYLIPGNHDGNWSESGGNTFRKVFGDEKFYFKYKGYDFIGINSGPNMRMSPGQIPRENLVWMDSVFKAHPNDRTPLIYVNHYPQDSSLNNWFDAVNLLKKRNIQLAICGHGHTDKAYNWEGIPGVMCRSNLRAEKPFGGYNIVTIDQGKAVFQVKFVNKAQAERPWETVPMFDHHFDKEHTAYDRPSYALNQKEPSKYRVNWVYQDQSDIGAGLAVYDGKIITANTNGELYALDLKQGHLIWKYKTNGKIYSTPAIWNNVVVVGSSDHFIYGIDAQKGKELWRVSKNKAVLGSPLIVKGIAYIGSSDGTFSAVDVRSGREIWTFTGVKGYVSAKPLFYKGKIIFGSWKNGFYALNAQTGKLSWEWNSGNENRMFSAAACYPVAVQNRIFIVAPDRFMTCLDAETGRVIWREKNADFRVRESMGLSEDQKMVYVKTMEGKVLGISTTSDVMKVIWQSKLQLPYEIAPTDISAYKKRVFVPSQSGVLSVVQANTGALDWQYKISNCLINPFAFYKNTVFVSTMDGKIVSLNFK